ncbi:MAG: bifunctional glutamate N-acetyltransferase/amino-acid acetyltransferase ArgJ [Spirochaetes bacterium]|nr:bifunctional glutamate N-acetyltransferase/amino-acid acetyltransferase ArgJ [Spirochaetota bacterium]MBN2770531.1 bifunctional glutamate N-acetyltransferase/amino-acid acetyltransferase ArgJ [Spirochaetota bacterium]
MSNKIFSFSAVKSGIKYSDKYDFALIYSNTPCNCAATFTTNKVCAAPVIVSKERMANPIQAIVVNSSNANACTGEMGLENAKNITSTIGSALNIDPESILAASTGVIGVQLPAQKMIDSIPDLTSNLSGNNQNLFAQAIMTTDTVPKYVKKTFIAGTKTYTIEGFAKGSGMIAPNMATLLSFIVTDAPVEKNLLRDIFFDAISKTYNCITIDGDMSTNDSAFILSPLSDNYLDEKGTNIFKDTLYQLLEELALILVKDGEGATRCVKINVKNAVNNDEARICACAVAESLLVKTAIFGKDPNWGRIACAAGYSGAQLDQNTLSIYFNDIPLLLSGTPVGYDKDRLIEIMNSESYEINIDIGSGDGSWSYWTSDISYDYVKINSEYTT